jgi:hypothetical protein
MGLQEVGLGKLNGSRKPAPQHRGAPPEVSQRQARPRVTLMIWDKEGPYRFVEVRGEVVEGVKGPEARKHIDELSHKYHDRLYQTRIRSERVVLWIAPL